DAVAVAEEAGAETDDDGSLIAVRSVGKDGRSRAHLGGRSVPVGALAQLSEHLIAVHGQNDQLRLLRPGEQLAVLDRFAGESVAEPLAAYQRVRAEWQAVVAELAERTTRSRELAQQADMLRHALAEINAVEPQPGEDQQIAAEVKRLAEAEELRSTAQRAQQAVAGAADGDPDQPGGLGLIGVAMLRHALAETYALEPQPGEDQQIAAEVQRLAEADELPSAAQRAQQAVAGAADGDPDQPGVLGLIGEAKRRLEATDDPALAE